MVQAGSTSLLAQPRRRPAVKKAAPVSLKTDAAQLTCPAELGVGVKTKRRFCDVLTGREVAQGIIVKIPPHIGPATLLFTLHNRHTYSEEQVRAHQAYARYTATIGVLTPDNVLLQRAVVQSEFRTAGDVFDWIGGGAGPGGVKAVAPTGAETIAVAIPDKITQLSVLGEKLNVIRTNGPESYQAPGRPIATISDVRVEYRPAPAAATRRR